MGMDGLSQFLAAPRRPSGAATAIAELAKEISDQVKNLKKPAIKGGRRRRRGRRPEQVEDITKLPSREVLIGQVLTLLLSPAREALALVTSPASTLIGQLEAFIEKNQGPGDAGTAAEPAPDDAGTAAEPAPDDAGTAAEPASGEATSRSCLNRTNDDAGQEVGQAFQPDGPAESGWKA